MVTGTSTQSSLYSRRTGPTFPTKPQLFNTSAGCQRVSLGYASVASSVGSPQAGEKKRSVVFRNSEHLAILGYKGTSGDRIFSELRRLPGAIVKSVLSRCAGRSDFRPDPCPQSPSHTRFHNERAFSDRLSERQGGSEKPGGVRTSGFGTNAHTMQCGVEVVHLLNEAGA